MKITSQVRENRSASVVCLVTLPANGRLVTRRTLLDLDGGIHTWSEKKFCPGYKGWHFQPTAVGTKRRSKMYYLGYTLG